MEGLTTVLGFRAPKPSATPPRMTLSHSPLTVKKLCTQKYHYPLFPAVKPCRILYSAPPRIFSAYYSSSKQYINYEGKMELKTNLAKAGGIVISVAMAILSLQGIFCRSAFAAPSIPTSNSTSTSTPELDQEEEINKIFRDFLQPQKQDESADSKNPSDPMPDREELLKAFQRLPPDFQKEVVKRSLLAPIIAGNIDMAIDMLDSLIEERPDDFEWKLMKGYMLDDADRSAEAKQTFEEILLKDPFDAHALQGLATVMHRLGEDDAMIKMLEELVQKAQEQGIGGVAHNMKLVLAHVYVVQDNLERALKQYQLLIDENPEDFRPYLCQGIIYTVLDKKDEAEERFEKYNKLVPDSFSKQSFLDEVMVKVQIEAEKLSQVRKKQQKLMEEGKSPEEAKQSGKPMEQPRFR